MSASILRNLLLAICVCGFAVSANARDRDNDGGWRLGLGHDHYGIYRWDGRHWRRMPGSATAVGDGWVIGTDRRSGGYGIYRWSGRGWNRVPGGAVTIGGTYERPWVINNRGETFHWNGYDWNRARGNHRSFSPDFRSHSYEREERRDTGRYRSRNGW